VPVDERRRWAGADSIGREAGEGEDRLPTTLEGLKVTKGGLVCYLFFSGKGREDIAKEVATAFRLTETQAGKIARRITGRAASPSGPSS
jgi:hypothetical protein